MPQLTNTIIEAAIAGFEAQKKSIDIQIAELRGMLNGASGVRTRASAGQASATKPHRKFSAAARQRMRAAQRARWAKARGESPALAKTATAAKPSKKTGGLTPEGRKKLSQMMKKRWEAKRAAA